MSAAFWDGIGTKLAERWASTSVPALVFWLGGVLAWMIGDGGVHALDAPARRLGTWSTAAQVAALLAALIFVGASGVVVGRLTAPFLTLMEGYWPSPLAPVRDPLVRRISNRRDTVDAQYQKLAPLVAANNATPEQQAEYARITSQLRRWPDSSPLLPTRLGNTLLAAETHPADKYGLDAVRLWPQLWLLMPDPTRAAVGTARESLDRAVSACVWGLLFIGFAPLSLWAIPAGLGVAAASAWLWAPARAAVFADLLEAAFDLYRLDLYRQLRWPLPTNPKDERVAGAQMTEYLVRGLSKPWPTFTADPAAGGPTAGT
jgi:hypothetical protein